MGQSASKITTEASKAAMKRRQALTNHQDSILASTATSTASSATSSNPSQRNNNNNNNSINNGEEEDVVPNQRLSFHAVSRRTQQHQADTAHRIANAASSRSDQSGGENSHFFNNNNNSSSSASNTTPSLELPPELLKFLTDAGPVTRVVDEKFTSPRVYDALVKDSTMDREYTRLANSTRVRRRMPIVSSNKEEIAAADDDDELKEDGTMTDRTTNFSNSTRMTRNEKFKSGSSSSSNNSHPPFHVTRHDFYRLAIQLQSEKQKNGELVVGDSPEWKKIINDHYGEMILNQNKVVENSSSEDDPKDKDDDRDNINNNNSKITSSSRIGFDQLKDITMLENCARYIGVPVLMKDTEGDIIGMWHHKLQDRKYSLGLKPVPKNSLQFMAVMENESGK